MYNEKDETQDVEDDRRVFEELSFSRLIVVPLFFIDIFIKKLKWIHKWLPYNRELTDEWTVNR